MAGEWLLATQFAAAALMVLLAGWLLWLDAARVAVRAFAAFLLLRAGLIVVGRIGLLLNDPTLEETAVRAAPYYDFALLGAIIIFVLVYPRRRGIARRAWGIPLVVATTGAALGAYALDPCAAQCEVDGRLALGPLAVLEATVGTLAPAAAALVLAKSLRHQPQGHARVSLALVVAGFLADGAVGSGAFVAGFLRQPDATLGAFMPSVWTTLALAAPFVALGFIALACALLLAPRAASADGGTRAIAWRLSAVAFAAGATGTAAALSAGAVGEDTSALFAGLLGVWRLALPLMAATALARYRLFDVDLRARKLVNGASLGAFFAGIFFIVSETVANLLGPLVGTYVGIGAAGALLFMLVPLQHATERIASVAVGEPSHLRRMTHEERLALYRELAERAWEDDRLERSERAFLDELRQRLGLTFEEAARTESSVAEAARPPSPTEAPT